jgi:hypothetical protein
MALARLSTVAGVVIPDTVLCSAAVGIGCTFQGQPIPTAAQLMSLAPYEVKPEAMIGATT